MSDTSFIKLGDASTAPILNYSMPEGTTYTGRQYVELKAPSDWFNPPAASSLPVMTGIETDTLVRTLAEEYRIEGESLATGSAFLSEEFSIAAPTLEEEADRIRDTIDASVRDGMAPVVLENLAGAKRLEFVPRPAKREGSIFLIETYKMSSFLGDYGAGKILNTFSLLPGEKTKITIRSYTKSKVQRKESESIFDSFSKESAASFEDSLRQENSRKQEKKNALSWHASASAGASLFSVVSVSATAGGAGSVNAKRSEMVKNVKNATSKHASKASAKRNIQVNTSSEESIETSNEESIERDLENVNLSRTLNFVFRQMNQEFITLLSLVDVRVGYHDGFSDSYDEASLAELDDFLEKHIQPNKRDEAKSVILRETSHVIDHKGEWVPFVEEKQTPPVSGAAEGFKYHSVTEKYDTYQGPNGGLAIQVPGIIVSTQTNTLRTEGVIVEAILGQAEALDQYALGMQQEEIAEKQAENRILGVEAEKMQYLMQLLDMGELEKAKILADVLKPPSQLIS